LLMVEYLKEHRPLFKIEFDLGSTLKSVLNIILFELCSEDVT